jgi:dihydropteroate synthase
MGILNVTPDSFSDGGKFLDPSLAERRALQMQHEGADLIDIGGESSRPGAKGISVREECRRILPVIKRLKKNLRIPISVDTCKTEVAHAALNEGVVLVNDIRGLKGNRKLARLIARYGASVVLMHMRGIPRSMQKNPRYPGGLIKEIRLFLREAAGRALDAGIPVSRILIDPGFGFGKTTEQNIELLRGLSEFRDLRFPLLVGLSRKSFIGALLGGADVSERLYGSLGAAAAGIAGGAHILRVHDVRAHRQIANVCDAVF